MATTTGSVLSVAYSGDTACVRIGPTPAAAEVLFIAFTAADSAQARTFKRAMLGAFTQACERGFAVEASHPDNGGEISGMSVLTGSICPVGPIIQNDFLGISGTAIPSDAVAVFQTATATITVTPQLVRPHWMLISQLPAAIPVGRCTLWLQAAGWTSDRVPMQVEAGPRVRVRTLYPGAPTTSPYAITFAANPAIEAEAGGTFTADAVLSDRPGYHALVAYCLQNMLTVSEDVLRRGDLDRDIRLVSVFDETRTASAATALAHEVSPDIMETRRAGLASFVAGYSVAADVVLVMYSSTTHDRASAWFSSDDTAKAGTDFTYDGVGRSHRHFATVPGSAAIPTDVDTTGVTPLHEFGHASSDFTDGMVIDLYVDDMRSGFVENKKARAKTTDAIPVSFATYNGTTYKSDTGRGGLGYPTTWFSYQPELIDSTRPNLMDNFWLTPDHQKCRLDLLTYAWLSDRLHAKTNRQV